MVGAVALLFPSPIDGFGCFAAACVVRGGRRVLFRGRILASARVRLPLIIFAAGDGHADLEDLDDPGKTWRRLPLEIQRAGAFEPWLSGGLDPLLARAVTPVYGLARGVPLVDP